MKYNRINTYLSLGSEKIFSKDCFIDDLDIYETSKTECERLIDFLHLKRTSSPQELIIQYYNKKEKIVTNWNYLYFKNFPKNITEKIVFWKLIFNVYAILAFISSFYPPLFIYNYLSANPLGRTSLVLMLHILLYLIILVMVMTYLLIKGQFEYSFFSSVNIIIGSLVYVLMLPIILLIASAPNTSKSLNNLIVFISSLPKACIPLFMLLLCYLPLILILTLYHRKPLSFKHNLKKMGVKVLEPELSNIELYDLKLELTQALKRLNSYSYPIFSLRSMIYPLSSHPWYQHRFVLIFSSDVKAIDEMNATKMYIKVKKAYYPFLLFLLTPSLINISYIVIGRNNWTVFTKFWLLVGILSLIVIESVLKALILKKGHTDISNPIEYYCFTSFKITEKELYLGLSNGDVLVLEELKAVNEVSTREYIPEIFLPYVPETSLKIEFKQGEIILLGESLARLEQLKNKSKTEKEKKKQKIEVLTKVYKTKSSS